MRTYSAGLNSTGARRAAPLTTAMRAYPIRLLVAIVAPVAAATVTEQLLTWLPALLGK